MTGALLVGGASRRFGSPKALARLDGEPLAERAHRLLRATFANVIAVGKAGDALPLPFEVLDDGSETRAALVGIAAALRLAPDEVVVCLPTDMPFVPAELLTALAEAVEGADAATTQTGPLPAALRRSLSPLFERRIAAGDLAVHRALAEADVRVVHADPEVLRNVNTVDDLVA